MAGGREGARAQPPEADPHGLGGPRFASAPVCQLPPVALDPASYATTDAVWASGLPTISVFRRQPPSPPRSCCQPHGGHEAVVPRPPPAE